MCKLPTLLHGGFWITTYIGISDQGCTQAPLAFKQVSNGWGVLADTKTVVSVWCVKRCRYSSRSCDSLALRGALQCHQLGYVTRRKAGEGIHYQYQEHSWEPKIKKKRNFFNGCYHLLVVWSRHNPLLSTSEYVVNTQNALHSEAQFRMTEY